MIRSGQDYTDTMIRVVKLYGEDQGDYTDTMIRVVKLHGEDQGKIIQTR